MELLDKLAGLPRLLEAVLTPFLWRISPMRPLKFLVADVSFNNFAFLGTVWIPKGRLYWISEYTYFIQYTYIFSVDISTYRDVYVLIHLHFAAENGFRPRPYMWSLSLRWSCSVSRFCQRLGAFRGVLWGSYSTHGRTEFWRYLTSNYVQPPFTTKFGSFLADPVVPEFGGDEFVGWSVSWKNLEVTWGYDFLPQMACHMPGTPALSMTTGMKQSELVKEQRVLRNFYHKQFM